MASPKVGTFLSSSAKGNREELSDVVDVTARKETPVYSMIGKATAKSTSPSWETDDLDTPEDDAQEEGREYDFADSTPAVRLENNTQIFEKTGRFSNTQEAVDNAGNAEQIKRKKVLKGIALRKNIEFSLVASNPSLGGATRKSGSLTTWAESNVSRGAAGANGGYNIATKLTEAPTNATLQRSLTKALIDEVLRKGFDSGANLQHAFMTSYLKEVFAGFMSDPAVAQLRSQVTKGGKAVLYGDVEMYRGPNGLIYVHPNAVMSTNSTTARNFLMLDTTKIKWNWLRKIKEDKDLAKTGDAKSFVLQGEGCSKVSNEKAVGVIADLFGLSATT